MKKFGAWVSMCFLVLNTGCFLYMLTQPDWHFGLLSFFVSCYFAIDIGEYMRAGLYKPVLPF